MEQPKRNLRVMTIGIESLDLRVLTNCSTTEIALVQLARALSTSIWWREVNSATIVVRTSPKPMLAVVGYFDAASEARMKALVWQLRHVLPRLRYISYQQVEKACELLAMRLLERFSHDEIQQAPFISIPRGGYIVLGILSYILDLKHTQLNSSSPPNAPLVIVDDCALSGVRFGDFLKTVPNQSIVFAHLFSHPKLRAAIEAQEEQVIACLSAHDLHDFAPEQYGRDYLAWQEKWLSRMSVDAYWVGQTEHLCFPWSEPDVGVWNEVAKREERGFNLVPPELCLKNRLPSNITPANIYMQPSGPGPITPSSDVVFAKLANQTVIGNLATSEVITVTGVASDMWHALVEHGSKTRALKDLARVYDVEENMLVEDFDAFVHNLVIGGYLVQKALGIHD